jgi:hypothetical protein
MIMVKYNHIFPISQKEHWTLTIMALGLTQPLTEMWTRNFPADKGRPTRNALSRRRVCIDVPTTLASAFGYRFLVHRFLSPWWWRRCVPPKRRFLQEPHGVTTQNMAFFIMKIICGDILWSQEYVYRCDSIWMEPCLRTLLCMHHTNLSRTEFVP